MLQEPLQDLHYDVHSMELRLSSMLCIGVQIGGGGRGAVDVAGGAMRLLRAGFPGKGPHEVAGVVHGRMFGCTIPPQANLVAGSAVSKEAGGKSPMTVYAVDATVVVVVVVPARSEVGGGLNAAGPSGNPPDGLLGAANQLLCEGARCDRSLTTQRSPSEAL